MFLIIIMMLLLLHLVSLSYRKQMAGVKRLNHSRDLLYADDDEYDEYDAAVDMRKVRSVHVNTGSKKHLNDVIMKSFTFCLQQQNHSRDEMEFIRYA